MGQLTVVLAGIYRQAQMQTTILRKDLVGRVPIIGGITLLQLERVEYTALRTDNDVVL